MNSVLTDTEKRLDEIVVLQTRLALEHIQIYNKSGVEQRLKVIRKQIAELTKERERLLNQ